MKCSDVLIRPAMPDDLPAISKLHAESFGPGRFARTAYRIREESGCERIFGLTAWLSGGPELVGSVHFTAVEIGGKEGVVLLGPLAVAPRFKNRGCGSRLLGGGVEAARAARFALVVLVGDLSYYGRAGFKPLCEGQVILPGPADPKRLLAYELVSGAASGYAGLLRPLPRRNLAALAQPGQPEQPDQHGERCEAGK